MQALNTVLYGSLYTSEIFVWLGDSEDGQDFMLEYKHKHIAQPAGATIQSGDTLITYLKDNPHFNVDAKEQSPEWKNVKEGKTVLLESLSR